MTARDDCAGRAAEMTTRAIRAEVRVLDTVYEETGKLDRARFDALLEELDRRCAAYPDECGSGL